MVYYHGILDYFLIKKDGQNIILLLDNHQLEEYCNYPAQNVNSLLEDFLIEDKSTIILEEIYGTVNFEKLFSSKHLNIYNEFYENNKDNNKIIPTDVRLLFKIDNNLKILFDLTNEQNIELTPIKSIINKFKVKNEIFAQHYEKLKLDYIRLSQSELISNINREHINLTYPFYIETDEILKIQWSTFYSGLMELYAISHILNSDKKYIINYFGAAHCASIFKLLVTYYGYDIKRNNKLKLDEIDFIKYNEFSSLGNMCIDFTTKI
jgi:hypothetical protein